MIITTSRQSPDPTSSLVDQILVPREYGPYGCGCVYGAPLVSSLPDNAPVKVIGSYCSGSVALFTVINVIPHNDASNPAIELKAETGLGVGILAKIAGVSRQGYYDWLSGSGIASEKRDRLERLVNTFRVIRREKRDLVHFLSENTGQGKIADLLAIGREDIVLAITSRVQTHFDHPTQSVWDGLAQRVRGITHNDGGSRGRRQYSSVDVADVNDGTALARAEIRPPRRRKRSS